MKNSTEQHWIAANLDHPTEWYTQRVEFLRRFMGEERMATLQRALDGRTDYAAVCLENTFHPQNASAIMRTCEAFGIQNIHTIQEHCRFNPNVNIVRGTDKWIDMHSYGTTTEALTALKTAGYRIVATSPHAEDRTPDTFDVTSGPFVLVFGTEQEGISDEVRAAADEFIKIPMQGMVESLNVSVSAAVLLYTLSCRIRKEVADWQLSPHRSAVTQWKWYMESVRDSIAILEKYFEQR